MYHLSVCNLSIHLSIYRSIYLSIYLYVDNTIPYECINLPRPMLYPRLILRSLQKDGCIQHTPGNIQLLKVNEVVLAWYIEAKVPVNLCAQNGKFGKQQS